MYSKNSYADESSEGGGAIEAPQLGVRRKSKKLAQVSLPPPWVAPHGGSDSEEEMEAMQGKKSNRDKISSRAAAPRSSTSTEDSNGHEDIEVLHVQKSTKNKKLLRTPPSYRWAKVDSDGEEEVDVPQVRTSDKGQLLHQAVPPHFWGNSDSDGEEEVCIPKLKKGKKKSELPNTSVQQLPTASMSPLQTILLHATDQSARSKDGQEVHVPRQEAKHVDHQPERQINISSGSRHAQQIKRNPHPTPPATPKASIVVDPSISKKEECSDDSGAPCAQQARGLDEVLEAAILANNERAEASFIASMRQCGLDEDAITNILRTKHTGGKIAPTDTTTAAIPARASFVTSSMPTTHRPATKSPTLLDSNLDLSAH